MGVLVAVNVGEANSLRLDPADLRLRFPSYFVRRDLFPQGGPAKIFNAAAESAVVCNQGWNVLAHRLAINQHDMAAGLELGCLTRQRDCFRKCFRAGHDGGGKRSPGTCSLNDGSVYSRGKAKIVSIDNEAGHG